MGGDRGIIKIVLGFRPTFIAAVVDWTELAMLITDLCATLSGKNASETGSPDFKHAKPKY
jgi:hypothetical protein